LSKTYRRRAFDVSLFSESRKFKCCEHVFFMLAETKLVGVGVIAAVQFDAWKNDVEERDTEVTFLKQ